MRKPGNGDCFYATGLGLPCRLGIHKRLGKEVSHVCLWTLIGPIAWLYSVEVRRNS